MGANASSLSRRATRTGLSTRPKLDDIPESCIALVLSHLDPPEIAMLARLNRTFRSASTADFIWVPKLPSNYLYILDNLPYKSLRDKGKMGIYAWLCRGIPFDGGTKEVWIDKRTGGVCLAVSSRGMMITGIDDRRYWNYIPNEESRFQSVAYLHQIWWLEVEGDLEFQFAKGSYSLFFRLQLGRFSKKMSRRLCTPENAHGWDVKPVCFKLTTEDGQHAESRCMLDNLGIWVNYHVGDFVVEDENIMTKIKYSLTQIDCTHTKGGLCVDSVFVCPNSIGKRLCSVDNEM